MAKESNKTKILVVDDEQAFAEALSRQLESVGFDVDYATRPEDAMEKVETQKYDAAVIDCLLPGMSGVDLGQKIKETVNGQSAAIVFISGIYTDKKFVKEAQQSTGAIGFFEKPFETNELAHLLSQHFRSKSISPQKRLHELLAKPKASSREKRRAIEALERVHGFDLPLIFSLLVETKSSGHLNIVNEEGVVSGISFSKGLIVNVDVADAETYIGRLLINHGFIRPVDLESALSSVNQRKIGERLIQANLLSPHALGIALSEQMNIRLSRTIVAGLIELNFVPCEVPLKYPNIDADDFKDFLSDWIQTKLTPDWLRSLYHYWGGHAFGRGPAYTEKEGILGSSQHLQMAEYLLSGRRLDEYLDERRYRSEELLRSIHLLIMKRILVFQESQKKGDPADQMKSLKKFAQDMKSKNHFQLFEMLGAGHDQLAESASSCFEEFKIWLKATGDSADPEVVKLRNLIQARVQEAYNIIADPQALKAYQKKLGEDALQEKLRARGLISEAEQFLKSSQYKKAFDLLVKAKASSSNVENVRLYYIWAKAGANPLEGNPTLQAEIEKELAAIPPEERYSALYAYVQGFFLKSCGQFEAAKKSFEKAIFMDPKMIEAKREINMMKAKPKAPKNDLMNRDIRDIFSSFFSKKKSS